MENKKKKKGFTLIEMVVVIAIIAIIAGIAIPQAFKSLKNAKVTADIANAKNIANAITQGLAEDKELKTTSGWEIVEGNVKKEATDETGWLDTYMTDVPKVKYNNSDGTKVFCYTYDGDVLKVGVGTKGSGVAVTGGHEVYPNSDGYK